jgi:hypothetical protein
MGGDWYVSNESTALEVVASPAASITGTNQFCIGTTTALTVSTSAGKAPFTYAWYAGTTQTSDNTDKITISKSGDYLVIITDANGCVYNSQAVKVSEKGVAATITPDGQTTVYQPNTVKLNANTVASATYQWQKNTTDIAGATTANLEAKESGDYTVTLKVDGCTSVSSAVKVAIDVLLSSEIPFNAQEIEIETFPNPTEQSITITLEKVTKGNTIMELTDIQGRALLQREITEEKTNVNLQNFPAGTYLLRVLQGEKVLVKKVVKN